MIDIEILGKIRNYGLTHYYVTKVLKRLNIHKLKNRELIIEFKTKLDGGIFLGLCEGDSSSCHVKVAKVCPITGNKLTYLQMMKTLTHELVHVKQMFRKELIADSTWTWKGRSAEGYKYDNQPWEKEAYKLQEEIFISDFPIEVPFTN